MTTLSELERSPRLRAAAPSHAPCAHCRTSAFAMWRRSEATSRGDPHMDLPPILMDVSTRESERLARRDNAG